MDEKRGMLLFIILSVILVLYFWFFSPKTENKNVDSNSLQTNLSSEDNKDIKEIVKNSEQFELENIPQKITYDLKYENNFILIEFDPKEAVIKHAFIKDTFLHRKENKSYDLVEAKDKEGALLLKFGSWDSEKTLDSLTGGKNLYHYERIGNDFIFTCNLKNRIDNTIYTVIKKYSFIDNEYLFKLEIEIYNNKNTPLVFDNSKMTYSLGWGPILGIDIHDKNIRKNQKNVFSYFNGNKVIDILDNDKIFKNKNNFATINKEGGDSWLASNGHYFVSLIYPDNQNYDYFFDYRRKDKDIYYCGLSRISDTSLSKIKSTFYIYIGPKESSVIDKYDNFKGFNLENTNISKINTITPIIGHIGIGILLILDVINNLVKNYGLSLIILTVLIKLVLFPLTHKSMESQQKISKLQPKLKVLQEKYKDKPDVLNKETMNLYKKEGINPLGGCLPILLQMPILFAMYESLSKMVGLKGASFLWIKDLSLPDSVINFSYMIPFVNINSLNILPIIMTIVSVVSGLTMPDSQTNKQAKIMMWMMPLIFFFIFYNVASGLVLYWTVMNILNLAQQIWMNKTKKI